MNTYTITEKTARAALREHERLCEDWPRRIPSDDFARVRFVNGITTEHLLPIRRVAQWLAASPGKLAEINFPGGEPDMMRSPDERKEPVFVSAHGKKESPLAPDGAAQFYGYDFGADDKHTPDDWPVVELRAPAEGGEFKLADNGVEFAKEIGVVGRFVTRDDSRYILLCVHVDAGDRPAMTATSGKFLFTIAGDFGPEREINPATMRPHDLDGAQFPAWRGVMPPADTRLVCRVKTKEAAALLKKAAKLSADKEHCLVTLGYAGKRDGAELCAEVSADADTSRSHIGPKADEWLAGAWNAEYLAAGFKALADLGHESAEIRHSGSGNAGLGKHWLDPLLIVAGPCRYVLMPVK